MSEESPITGLKVTGIGPCPECAMTEEHSDTCALVLALEAVSRADASWFRQFPELNFRIRPIMAPEMIEMRWSGVWAPAGSSIRVERLPGGLRSRSLVLPGAGLS